MFKRLSHNEIMLFSRFFITIMMLIQLFRLPYFVSLSETLFIDFSTTLTGSFFKENFYLLVILYSGLGIFYFIKPKLILPIVIILYLFVQGTINSFVEWHDQNVSFYLFTAITIYHFKPKWFKSLPIRELTLLFFSIQFFGASVSKLKDSGLAWLDGHVVQFILVENHILYNNPFGLWIAQSLTFCRIIATLGICFQLSYSLCLYFKCLQKFYAIGTFMFILSVHILFKIDLSFMWPALTPFLPWHKIYKVFQKIRPRKVQ